MMIRQVPHKFCFHPGHFGRIVVPVRFGEAGGGGRRQAVEIALAEQDQHVAPIVEQELAREVIRDRQSVTPKREVLAQRLRHLQVVAGGAPEVGVIAVVG